MELPTPNNRRPDRPFPGDRGVSTSTDPMQTTSMGGVMRRVRNLKGMMAAVAVFAIYLAALQAMRSGPSGDPFTIWLQGVSSILLFLVLPFHVMALWSRSTDRGGD